jgi:hypothetical protein
VRPGRAAGRIVVEQAAIEPLDALEAEPAAPPHGAEQRAPERCRLRRPRGIGLLKHGLTRAVAGARLIGGRALVVHALDASAAAFWRRRSFLPAKDDPLTLFRPLPDIAASLEAAAEGDC